MSKLNLSDSAVWLSRHTPPHIITLVLLASISALNMNIFLPSLPGMAAYFDAEYSFMMLAISAYLGVTAVLQLIIGPLSDRFGRRIVLLWSMVIFLLATLGCILSPTVGIFLFFRMFQGAIAAGMVLSRAIVRDMVKPAEAASMIGYITMGMSVVPMLGPVLGGYLQKAFGWQSSFTLVLVFGLLVTWLVWADLGETNTSKSSSFKAQFKAYPELIRSRRFWGYALSAGFAAGAFFAFLGGAPFVASIVLGLDPAELGLYFIFISAGYMAGNYLSGRFSSRVGLNQMMLYGGIVGSAGMALTLVLFYAGFETPLAFFGTMSILGIGNGMTLPNANAGIVSVRPHLAGSASGLGGAVLIGGGAGLSAIGGGLLTAESGAYPLLYLMLASSLLSVVISLYVIYVARSAGELSEDGFDD
ncbi:MAG: multidrug effflux MFS transporter [Paracoccaceae bacterium]